MKPKLLYFVPQLFTLVMLLFAVSNSSAQSIVLNAPQPADNPNLPGNSPWSAICAGNAGFNEFYANITWAGTANGGNEFILELSDAAGNFASPVELGRVNDQNSNADFDMMFAIPTNTRGQGYKMRVRSTDPAKTSPTSSAYNMYYMDVTTNLNISELGNGVPPGSICATGPFTLQVDNIANPETYQYIWYRSGSELTGEKGHTLNVTQSGMYSAFIDYGPECTGSGNTDSNIVDVTIGSTGQGIFINPPSNTALCNGDTETLSINTTDSSWNYKWYKNGTLILGATNSSYIVNAASLGFEGDYQVEISSSSICTERSAAITITNADNFTVTRVNPANLVLLPTQTKTLSATTSANTPTYQWYRNGSLVSGATNASLDITQDGTYYVAVTQGGGACPGTIKNSEQTIVAIPASFEIVIAFDTPYTPCVSTSAVLNTQTINAVLSDGSKIDVTADLETSFTYQWKKDNTNVAGATSSSISLTSTMENGTYLVDGTLNSFIASSNALSATLLTNEAVTISSTSTIYCSASDTITISTATDLSNETFAWQKDGVDITTTDIELTVNTPGTYRLVLDKNGCSLPSNEITISPLDPDLISLNPAGDILFPEGTSKTVSASGGTAYRWYDANNIEISNSASITFTEPGTYILIASIDNCEVSKELNVAYLETFKVPNVITVNGDGINDQWILPNSYSNKSDVNVVIYNSNGEEIINEYNYKNNWPQSTTSFTKQNMVFYYKIKNDKEVLKQGTITVIR
ncbi:MAG: gliding motility-associated C-terminal domain-containing protein [Maribacter sp.]|nr:gliding motility-associated C-terminal domain-containing protein [Maribacter sp.]